MAECAENATELPEFAKESLEFGQIWIRIIAKLKKKKNMIFQEVYMGVQELYSDLLAFFACILLCIRMDSGSYSGHSGQIWLYSCYSGLFGQMIRVVSPLTIRLSPNLPRMPRTPPRIRLNPIRMYPEYGPNEICRGHIRDHF